MTAVAPIDAWLTALPLAERAAAAAATETRLWGWCVGWALVVGVCFAAARLGWLARLRAAIERDGPRPWLASAGLGGGLALAVLLVRAPFDAVVGWRCDWLLNGASATSYGGHLTAALVAAPPLAGLAILAAPPLQFMMRKAPRAWPWAAGAAAIVISLAWGWLPYALSSGPPMAPAPTTATTRGLSDLIRTTGLPARQIYVSRRADMDIDVTGGFGRAVVVVGPALGRATVAEARAFAAHLMGHYAHGDIFSIYLLAGLLALVACLAVQAACRPLAKWMGGTGVEGPGDPEGLAAAAVIGAAALAASTVVFAGYIQWVNVRADAYSLDEAREPDGLAAFLVRNWDHQDVDPGPLARAVLYTHPPLKSRLAQAMAWKAAHAR
ncbi:MAG: M48 family metalloprotease [Caulobacteraceae bacterium]|nr:M48 family metalloprotease [Caulobacteraceae bacterium]